MTPAEFRAAREALGLTPAEMAAALKVAENTIRRWEWGRVPISGPAAVAVRLMVEAREGREKHP